MRFTFDLSPDQSNRIIDQAIRHRAEVVLEPRGWTDGTTLTVRVRGSDGNLLLAENAVAPDQPMEGLIGMHLDAQMILGQTLYLFDTHLVDLDTTEPQVLLLLARPEVLQVAQRRRFQRMALQSGCKVHLDSKRLPHGGAVIGELLNLSPDGMACRLDEATAEPIRVGEPVHVAFCPDDADRTFEFDAVLSNKSQAGSEGKVILGLLFQVAQDDQVAQADRRRLSEFLYAPPGVLAVQEGES